MPNVNKTPGFDYTTTKKKNVGKVNVAGEQKTQLKKAANNVMTKADKYMDQVTGSNFSFSKPVKSAKNAFINSTSKDMNKNAVKFANAINNDATRYIADSGSSEKPEFSKKLTDMFKNEVGLDIRFKPGNKTIEKPVYKPGAHHEAEYSQPSVKHHEAQYGEPTVKHHEAQYGEPTVKHHDPEYKEEQTRKPVKDIGNRSSAVVKDPAFVDDEGTGNLSGFDDPRSKGDIGVQGNMANKNVRLVDTNGLRMTAHGKACSFDAKKSHIDSGKINVNGQRINLDENGKILVNGKEMANGDHILGKDNLGNDIKLSLSDAIDPLAFGADGKEKVSKLGQNFELTAGEGTIKSRRDEYLGDKMWSFKFTKTKDDGEKDGGVLPKMLDGKVNTEAEVNKMIDEDTVADAEVELNRPLKDNISGIKKTLVKEGYDETIPGQLIKDAYDEQIPGQLIKDAYDEQIPGQLIKDAYTEPGTWSKQKTKVKTGKFIIEGNKYESTKKPVIKDINRGHDKDGSPVGGGQANGPASGSGHGNAGGFSK